jgi:hypothetical protein
MLYYKKDYRVQETQLEETKKEVKVRVSGWIGLKIGKKAWEEEKVDKWVGGELGDASEERAGEAAAWVQWVVWFSVLGYPGYSGFAVKERFAVR